MVMCLSQKFIRKFATYDELPILLWLINMCMGAWSMLWLHFVIITHVQNNAILTKCGAFVVLV